MTRGEPACAVQWLGRGLLLLAVLMYIDPLNFGFGAFRINRDLGPVKYVLLGAALALLPVAGLALRARPVEIRQRCMAALAQGWALLPFMLLVVTGSLYARSALGIKETFLQMGLAPVGYVAGVMLYCAARDPAALVRAYFLMLYAALLYAVPMIVAKRLQSGQAFHTELFLIVPLALYAGLRARSAARRWLAVAAAVAIPLALHKNLAYLTMLICLVYLALVLRRRTARPLRSAPHRLLLACLKLALAAAALALLVFLVVNRQQYLPSGNPEVRLEVYQKVLDLFRSRPIIGDGFTGSALTALDHRLVLDSPYVTTHNDWLDTLSHGGLIGTVLLLAGVLLPLRFVVRRMRAQPAPTALLDILHTLIAMTLCAVLISLFVSLFNNLQLAFLFWMHLGLASAAAANLADGSTVKAATPEAGGDPVALVARADGAGVS